MSIENRDLNPKAIRKAYPDCPQREMALGLLREGKAELARDWLNSLDELIARGHSAFATEVREIGTGSF